MESLYGAMFAFIRFSTVFFFLPLFSMRNIPFMVKAGVSFLLALVVAPPGISIDSLTHPLMWVMLVFQEMAVGFVLVFSTILVFGIVYFAGQLIDVPMGFGMVSIFDPSSNMQIPVFSQFFHLLGSLVFLSIDGHLWLLRALARSYDILPLGEVFSLELTLQTFLTLGGRIFALGLQIALPVMGTILLTDLSLGIVTKAVPQINVFVLGFPIKIMVGMILLTFVLPYYVSFATSLFGYDGILVQAVQKLLLGVGDI